MTWTANALKVAILDLYEGAENQGMRCIREILNQYAEANGLFLIKDEFDVRSKNELPDLSYDVYISSGGPGSPIDSVELDWDINYMKWFDSVLEYNADENNEVKKQVFLICHSFQLVSRHLEIGTVSKRKSTSFGVFPIHQLDSAYEDAVFEGLNDPFYAVDSRDFQLVQPDHRRIANLGGRILAIEKARPHVPLERAVMAIRFNENVIGTQFHPEADAIGMLIHLQTEERKKNVIENYGFEKWETMIEHLNDPDKILFTYDHILPNFLNNAVSKMQTSAI